MPRMLRSIAAVACSGLPLLGCVGGTPGMESVAETEQEVSVCDETVPSNRIVDGIPAYSQCTASSNAFIYSNNGVDTATSAVSSDWKLTQRGGGYQCTELLHRYWLFHWTIDWIPNGDAGTWCNSTPPSTSGIVQTTTPVHGDAIVFAPGVCGVSSTYGHVALIDTVDTAGSKVTFVEQNNAGRRSSAFSCATCFLHVVANHGAAGSPSAGGTSSATGSSGGTTATGGTFTAAGRGQFGGATSPPTTGGAAPTTGGSIPTTGGATTANGGRASSGGSALLVTGGVTTAHGGGVANGGSTSSFSGGSTAAPQGGTTPIGGSMTTSQGSQVSPTGGHAEVGGASNGIGGATSMATGGKKIETTIEPSGGTATDGAPSNAAAGQGAPVFVGVAEPDAGCNCSVPRRKSSGGTTTGVVLALAALLGRRLSRSPSTKNIGRRKDR
jgi:hypothetical protein